MKRLLVCAVFLCSCAPIATPGADLSRQSAVQGVVTATPDLQSQINALQASANGTATKQASYATSTRIALENAYNGDILTHQAVMREITETQSAATSQAVVIALQATREYAPIAATMSVSATAQSIGATRRAAHDAEITRYNDEQNSAVMREIGKWGAGLFISAVLIAVLAIGLGFGLSVGESAIVAIGQARLALAQAEREAAAAEWYRAQIEVLENAPKQLTPPSQEKLAELHKTENAQIDDEQMRELADFLTLCIRSSDARSTFLTSSVHVKTDDGTQYNAEKWSDWKKFLEGLGVVKELKGKERGTKIQYPYNTLGRLRDAVVSGEFARKHSPALAEW